MPIHYIVSKSRNLHNWLFAQSTRVVEFLNMALLLGFSLPFIFNKEEILAIPMYRKFQAAGSPYWWWAMSILGLIQFAAMVKKGVHANQVSGFTLIFSGWIWASVAAAFLSALPPMTPAPVFSGIISLTCTLAGLYLLKYNKAIEDMYYK